MGAYGSLVKRPKPLPLRRRVLANHDARSFKRRAYIETLRVFGPYHRPGVYIRFADRSWRD